MRLDEHLDVAEVVVEHRGVWGDRVGRQRVAGRLHRRGVELRTPERALERAARADHDPRPDRAGGAPICLTAVIVTVPGGPDGSDGASDPRLA